MLDVRVNLLKNRLHITLDRMHRNRLDQSIPHVKTAAGKLTPGFACIIRFVGIREPDLTDANNVGKLQHLLAESGMGCVVYIGLTGCDRMQPAVEAVGFAAFIANTIEAAERQLDIWEDSVAPPAAGSCCGT